MSSATKLMHKIRNGTAKMCNCAGCGRLLLGSEHEAEWQVQSHEAKSKMPPPVSGRVVDRPYCGKCLADGLGLFGGLN